MASRFDAYDVERLPKTIDVSKVDPIFASHAESKDQHERGLGHVACDFVAHGNVVVYRGRHLLPPSLDGTTLQELKEWETTLQIFCFASMRAKAVCSELTQLNAVCFR